MYRARILFVLAGLYLFWLILSGNLTLTNLLLGGIVCLFTLLFFRGFLLGEPARRITLFSYLQRGIIFLLFLPIFFVQAYKSSLQVLRLLLSPELNLNQGIVEVNTEMENINGLTMLANIITLTPGTITVDVHAEEHHIYVHWINIKHSTRSGIRRDIIGDFEPWLMRIFERQ